MRAGFRMALLLLALPAAAATDSKVAVGVRTFRAEKAGEATAAIHAACARCAWDAVGREAVVLSLELDAHYSQHLVLLRGAEGVEYDVFLGPVAAGEHRLTLSVDRRLSAADAGAVSISNVVFSVAPN